VSFIPPTDIADLRERIRRRAFLVRQATKLKVKIRDVLAGEGVKPPGEYGLHTRKGVEWLRGLGFEPVDCYFRLMEPLKRETLTLSRELRGMTWDDPDVRLLMTIPGIRYYIALLIKAEIGDVERFSGGVERHGGITREGARASGQEACFGGCCKEASHCLLQRAGKPEAVLQSVALSGIDISPWKR